MFKINVKKNRSWKKNSRPPYPIVINSQASPISGVCRSSLFLHVVVIWSSTSYREDHYPSVRAWINARTRACLAFVLDRISTTLNALFWCGCVGEELRGLMSHGRRGRGTWECSTNSSFCSYTGKWKWTLEEFVFVSLQCWWFKIVCL